MTTHRLPAFARPAPEPPQPLKGLDALVHGWAGTLRRHGPEAGAILRLGREAAARENVWRGLRDHDLRLRLAGLRAQWRRHAGRIDDASLTDALAALREAARRTLGLNPYPEQLAGAVALFRGRLAEMATGEGKTLTSGLAAVLLAWARPSVHIITANDYLAERDAARLAPLYTFCGLRSGHVLGPMDPAERRVQYGAPVIHTTSKEVLADFLRDRLVLGTLHDPVRRLVREYLDPALRARLPVVQRGLHAAIVDEADSVLIDEAVTPLILSAPHPNDSLAGACTLACGLAENFESGRDYLVNARYREIRLTRDGQDRLDALAAGLPPIWRGRARRRELIVQAIEAREFHRRDQHYIIEDGKIIIVDEFTGRPMPSRSWREGMHQAVEAKEGLPLTQPNETSARLSFQRFFQIYPHLAGMTGTAWEAAPEFWRVYRLKTIRIPTHRPGRRTTLPPRFFATQSEKLDAIVEEIADLHRQGRPVLVGARHVASSEAIAARLEALGLPCHLLNARHNRDEAMIVAMAGQPSRITIATNMAGRGTDIELASGIAGLGGLHVIASELHSSPRIDRQLFGRGARQGDPGSARAFVSLEDDLLVRHLSAARRSMLAIALRGNFPGAGTLARQACRTAQSRAEAIATRQRRAVLRQDTWLGESLAFGESHL